jgi:hypothetical protein
MNPCLDGDQDTIKINLLIQGDSEAMEINVGNGFLGLLWPKKQTNVCTATEKYGVTTA